MLLEVSETNLHIADFQPSSYVGLVVLGLRFADPRLEYVSGLQP